MAPQPAGDMQSQLQKIWDAREKLLDAYRRQRIDYEKYLDYVRKLDEKEALLTSQAPVA
jgi:hypothetical protein